MTLDGKMESKHPEVSEEDSCKYFTISYASPEKYVETFIRQKDGSLKPNGKVLA